MTAPISRRALFSGAGKVAAAATLAALPVVATAALASHPDAAIFAALHRWRGAVLAYVHAPQEAFSDEWEALLVVANDEMRAIVDLQPTTIEGLAIKAFMAMRYEFGSGPDELMLDFEGGSMNDTGIPRSMVADLLRLSPTLAAAVA